MHVCGGVGSVVVGLIVNPLADELAVSIAAAISDTCPPEDDGKCKEELVDDIADAVAGESLGSLKLVSRSLTADNLNPGRPRITA